MKKLTYTQVFNRSFELLNLSSLEHYTKQQRAEFIEHVNKVYKQQ